MARRLPQPRLHKRSGNSRVRFNGHEYWLGPHGSPEAARRYLQLLADLGLTEPPAPAASAKPPAPPTRITIGEVCLRWLRDIEAARGPKCSAYYQARVVASAVRPWFGVPAAEFGSRRLLEVRRAFAKGGCVNASKKTGRETAKPRSRRHVNDTVRGVVAMLKWAAVLELIPPDKLPALAAVKALRPGELPTVRESARREPAPDKDFEAVLKHLPPATARILRFIRATACRPGEACNATWGELDRSGEVWVLRPARHKNAWRGQDRTILIGPRAQAAIAEIPVGSDDSHIFTQEPSRGPQSVRMERRPFTPTTIRQAVRRACRAAGVERWTTYQLRHARVQEVRSTAGDAAATVVLGDRSPRMLDTYSRRPDGAGVAAAAETG